MIGLSIWWFLLLFASAVVVLCRHSRRKVPVCARELRARAYIHVACIGQPNIHLLLLLLFFVTHVSFIFQYSPAVVGRFSIHGRNMEKNTHRHIRYIWKYVLRLKFIINLGIVFFSAESMFFIIMGACVNIEYTYIFFRSLLTRTATGVYIYFNIRLYEYNAYIVCLTLRNYTEITIIHKNCFFANHQIYIYIQFWSVHWSMWRQLSFWKKMFFP